MSPSFPAANYWNNAARTETEQKGWGEDFLATTKQLVGAGGALPTYTIAAGSITPAASPFGVETEGGTSTDDLTTIGQTNLPDGWVIYLRPINATHAVVVKHAAGGSGQIILANAADFTMNNTTMWLALYRNGTQWLELGRWYGNAATSFKTFYQVAGLGQNTFTGRQEWRQGADVASASTVALGTDGNVFVVTGGATINALSTMPAGTTVILKFATTCLLVDSAILILLCGTYVTRGGDALQFVSEGGGIWREVGCRSNSRVLDIIRTDVVAGAGSTAEVIVYQRAIPGGTLGTNRRLRLTIQGAWRFGAVPSLPPSYLTYGLLFRAYYGASQFLDAYVLGGIANNAGPSFVYGANYKSISTTITLAGSGATNAQIGHIAVATALLRNSGAITNYGEILGAVVDNIQGAPSAGFGGINENSLAAQNLAVTAQLNMPDATCEYVLQHAVLELLP